MKTETLNSDEINELLDVLMALKKSYKKYRTAKKLEKINAYLNVCVEKLDFLAVYNSAKYKQFPNYEDLLQEARIALMMALHTYNSEKGNFYAWSKRYIGTRLSRQANKHSTIKISMKKASINKPMKVEMPILTDTSANAYDNLNLQQARQLLNKAISKLPEKQKKVIELNSSGESVKEICSVLNIQKKDCIKLLKQARKNLKLSLISDNYHR